MAPNAKKKTKKRAGKMTLAPCCLCHGLGRDRQKGSDLFCTTCLGARVVSI